MGSGICRWEVKTETMKFYITDQTRAEIENRIRSINKNMHEMAMLTFGIDIDKSVGEKDRKELEMLEEILSNSAPIIPEIEKAFDASKITTGMNQRNQFAYKYKNSKDYVTNLKLDI